MKIKARIGHNLKDFEACESNKKLPGVIKNLECALFNVIILKTRSAGNILCSIPYCECPQTFVDILCFSYGNQGYALPGYGSPFVGHGGLWGAGAAGAAGAGAVKK